MISTLQNGSASNLLLPVAVDVLAVGEVAVDLISDQSAETLADVDAFRRHLGGEVANVALNVARLGGRSALVARVGDDGFGVAVRRSLEGAGVDVSHVSCDPIEPTSLIAVTRQTGTPDFLPYRGADRNLEPAMLPSLDGVRVVHSSAFALSLEPTRTTVLDAFRRAAAAGALVSLDPNYHPIVWRRRTEDAQQVLRDAFAFVDLTKPSLDDCARIFGPGLQPGEYARRFLDWGARRVVISMGRAGVLLVDGAGVETHFQAVPVPVVDVTGAGDALWAGLLLALIDGQSIDIAVLAGMSAAEHKLQHVGHIRAGVSRDDLYRHAAERLAGRRLPRPMADLTTHDRTGG